MCRHVFFNDTATTEIYTLSLHDALPILKVAVLATDGVEQVELERPWQTLEEAGAEPELVSLGSGTITDRKSTRLNSSHANISYAVFCLKKQNSNHYNTWYDSSYFNNTYA